MAMLRAAVRGVRAAGRPLWGPVRKRMKKMKGVGVGPEAYRGRCGLQGALRPAGDRGVWRGVTSWG